MTNVLWFCMCNIGMKIRAARVLEERNKSYIVVL